MHRHACLRSADGPEMVQIEPAMDLDAFGGTYPIEIMVPGANGFTDTLELQTSTFYGGDGTDGKLTEFAHAHGF